MSKDLRRSAERLEVEVVRKVKEIRRAVHAYNHSDDSTLNGATQRTDIERELEQAVGDYLRLHKSIKRLRKKMHM